MKTLRRSINKAEVGGEPLPPAFAAFERAGIILRRAEVTVIAGTPGAGKSSVALAIAAKTKHPTLYFSADTNAHTMAMRLIAMTGKMTQAAAETLLKRDPNRSHELLQHLQTFYHYQTFDLILLLELLIGHLINHPLQN